MVTTGVVEIAAVAGVAPGQSAQIGDNSVFAQLLGGAVSDAAVTSAAVTPVRSGGKPANVAAPDASVVPTEVLALCGLPVAAPAPTAPATPTPELVTSSEGQSNDVATMSTDAALQALAASESAVRIAVSQIQPGTGVASNTSSENVLPAGVSRGASAADLRWLDSGVHDPKADVSLTPVSASVADAAQLDAPAVQFTAQPSEQQAPEQSVEKFAGQTAAQTSPSTKQNIAEQVVATAQRTETAGRDVANVAAKPDSIVSAEQQPAFQKLMSQVTPLMNMINGQSRDIGIDQSAREVAFTDAHNPLSALHAAALQPAGTQLARDMPVLDVTPRHHLHAAIGSQQWAAELGDKLTMMAARDTQSATLYMTPADMGPVQVRIELNQDQASVWFTAEHAETRSALEQSLPKLREMFNAQGMSLTDAGVFGDRPRQQQPENNFTPSRFQGFQYEDSEVLADTAAVRTISLGLLDAYA